MNPHRFCACYFAITKSFCLLAACAETRARECFVPPGALRGKIPGGKSEAHVPPGALRGKTPEGKTEAHVPPGALRGKHRKRPPIQRCRALIVYVGTVCVGTRNPPEAFPTRLRRAHSLRGRTETTPRWCSAPAARSQCASASLATSHTLLQHLRLCGDSLCEDQKSFRSLSDAPPARAQSARGAADVSGVMRRASQRVRSVCAACAAA